MRTKLNKQQSLTKQKDILRDFSHELKSHICGSTQNIIQNIKNKKKQKYLLPQIKPKLQEQKQRELKKNHQKYYSNLENMTSLIQERINKLHKNNERFWNINSFIDMNDSDDENNNKQNQNKNQRCYIYPIIQPYPIISPMMQNMSNMNQNYFNMNSNSKEEDSEMQEKIPKQRLNYLKRRFRIIGKSILFFFVYRSFSKTVLYKRCLQSIQLQKRINGNILNIRRKFFQAFSYANLYQCFYLTFKELEENQIFQKKNKSFVVICQEQQIKINIGICQQFIGKILQNIKKFMKKGKFQLFIPILSNFLQRSFLLSHIFLKQQLRNMKINQTYGYLQINLLTTKNLIGNFFFLKIFVYQFLINKNNKQQFLKVMTQKSKKGEKLAETYTKKLKITLILLNQALNNVYFFSNKQTDSNYQKISRKLKVKPMTQLKFKYKFKLQQQNQIQNLSQNNQQYLIKNIECPLQLKQHFIFNFSENWKKIREIRNILYKDAYQYKKKLLLDIVDEAKCQKFVNRKLFQEMVNLKFKQASQQVKDTRNYQD